MHESLEHFLLTHVCPIEKVVLWVNLHSLALSSETDKGVTGDKVLEIEPVTPRSKPSTLSTKPSHHP